MRSRIMLSLELAAVASLLAALDADEVKMASRGRNANVTGLRLPGVAAVLTLVATQTAADVGAIHTLNVASPAMPIPGTFPTDLHAFNRNRQAAMPSCDTIKWRSFRPSQTPPRQRGHCRKPGSFY